MKGTFFAAAVLGLVVSGAVLAGDLAVSAYWQDHMVLQRGKPITVWGKDVAGRRITISFADATASAVTGEDGFWEATFAQPFALSSTPKTLTIVDEAGESLKLSDVLVGDVFLAAGQSNMDRRLVHDHTYEEPQAVKDFCRDDDGIRFIRIARSGENTNGRENLFDLPPHKAVNDAIRYFGQGYDWSPAVDTNKNFVSSLALNFAHEIRRSNAAKGRDIPIGIIHASSGGTGIRSWLRPEVLKANGFEPQPTDGGYWNNMMAPLLRAKFCAVLWYQGCSDAGRTTAEYQALMEVLVKDRRERWGENGDLPFYAVQIGTIGYDHGEVRTVGFDKYPEPSEINNGQNYAFIREAQRRWDRSDTGKHGLAVILDHVRCRDRGDLHPVDKNFVARRLSLFVRRDLYGEPELQAEGPHFTRAVRETNGTVRVWFKPGTAKGLTNGRLKMAGETALSRFVRMAGPVRGFALCGAEGVWREAEATVEGETVVLRADGIPRPTRFHYGYWSITRFDNLEFGQRLSLYNGAGLPLSPLPPTVVEEPDSAYDPRVVGETVLPPPATTPEPLWSTGAYDPAAWRPRANNLLSGKVGTSTGGLAWGTMSRNLANLTDGSIPVTPDDGKMVGFCDNAAIAWTFDTPQTITGLRLSTRIAASSGDYATRLKYCGLRIKDVYVRKSGASEWSPLKVGMYQKGGPANGAMFATLADDGLGKLAENVVGLRIVFLKGEAVWVNLAEIEATGYATDRVIKAELAE